ncbi:MAG: hypothetical protein BroJett014_24260 [Planctomycetota bacterium]|jgi:hypothetical protein|nr:MAG: hypothetical protein BroJett014_24260 [Planctomycetota bacterium]
MFTRCLFNLVSHLIFSRWVRGYEEHHGVCEDAYATRLGPLHLEVNQCFVLDHEDAAIGFQIPTWHYRNGRFQSGRLSLRYRVCRGTEPIRPSGVDIYWLRPLSQVPDSMADDTDFPL